MLDAYTIKKIMPRLVAAAILIQLSWPLVTGLIYLTAQISWGLEGLLFLPFGGRDKLDIGNILVGIGGGGGLAALFIVGGGLYILAGAPMLLSLLLLVFLALFVAFATLLFRQIVIVLLVVTSPIAIVAWVLPNTERLWKFWWGTLTKALLMYPMILLLFAGGRIGAYILSASIQSNGISETVGMLGAIVIFFAPFFLVSKTFGMAGGAIGMVGGALAARTGKMQSFMNKRAMNKQGQKWGERKQKFQAGGYGSDRNKFTRGVRNLGQMSGQSWTTGFGMTGKGKSNMALETNSRANELLKDDKFVNATFDDGARLALQYGNEKKARDAVAASRARYGTEDAYKEAVKRGEAVGPISEASFAKAKAVGYNKNTQLAALKAEASNKGRNYKGLAGINALNERISAVAQSTGISADDLSSDVSYGMRTQGGRFDLGKLDSSKTAEDQAMDGWKTGSLYQHATQGTKDSFDTVAAAARNKGGHDLAVFTQEATQVHQNGTGVVADAALEFANDGGVRAQNEAHFNAGGVQRGKENTQKRYVSDGAGGWKEEIVPVSTNLDRTNEEAARSAARVYKPPDPNDP